MSLLNDMLKDLNKKPTHHVASLVFSTDSFSWRKRLRSIAPWCILTLGLIIVFVFFKSSIKAPAKPLVLQSKLVPIVMPKTIEHHVAEAIDIMDAEQDVDTPHENEKLVNFTREDWYEEHINAALKAIQEGNDYRAVDVLSLILTEFPTSIEARENLAMLYLSHNELSNAYDVLNDGLSREPNNIRLITMKARLLAEQGSNHEALTLLEKYNPDINSSPEYYALLAAVLESLGHVSEAGGLYQSLVKIDSDNGQYWLGLGIALEHKHANQQAIEAYRRASESDNTRPAVRVYAESRLKTLQG